MDAAQSLVTLPAAGPATTEEERMLAVLLAVIPQVKFIKACVDADPSAVHDMEIVVSGATDAHERAEAESRFRGSALFGALLPLSKKLLSTNASGPHQADVSTTIEEKKRRARLDRKDRNSNPCEACKSSKLKCQTLKTRAKCRRCEKMRIDCVVPSKEKRIRGKKKLIETDPMDRMDDPDSTTIVANTTNAEIEQHVAGEQGAERAIPTNTNNNYHRDGIFMPGFSGDLNLNYLSPYFDYPYPYGAGTISMAGPSNSNTIPTSFPQQQGFR